MAFTIQQLQAFSNTKPELRYITEEIIDYLQANPGSSPGGGTSYLVYKALLSQTGTNAPVVEEEVLPNTLGVTITWTRTNVGEYKATASGAIFTANKTIFPPITDNVGGTFVPIYSANSPFGAAYSMYINSPTEAILYFNLANGNSVEWSTAAPSTKIFITIEVYP